MDKHINNCSLQQINCSYRPYGCDSVQLRKDYKQHLQEMALEHSEMMAIGLSIQ